MFCLTFRQIQIYSNKCRFFTGVTTFSVVQNNKPIIDAMNKINKRRKETFISVFDFFILYSIRSHNKLLMVFNSLIDFCFDGGESKYITVNGYRGCLVKNIKKIVICLNKQQVKDAVNYLSFNCYFMFDPQIFCQIIGFPMRSDPAPFLPTYCYIFMKVSG